MVHTIFEKHKKYIYFLALGEIKMVSVQKYVWKGV